MVRRKVLDVPYLVQPTSKTCQSTCLKMFAKYLEQKTLTSNPAGAKDIEQIWREINTSKERPFQIRNSYENMKWWLEKNFPPKKFHVLSFVSVDDAIRQVMRHVDHAYPVMVSTNHARTSGHIILVIGYETVVGTSNPDIKFFCHDPYGKFAPQLKSQQYGRNRYEGGVSLPSGGEVGPGKNVVYDYNGIRRIRSDKHSAGLFYLISAIC